MSATSSTAAAIPSSQGSAPRLRCLALASGEGIIGPPAPPPVVKVFSGAGAGPLPICAAQPCIGGWKFRAVVDVSAEGVYPISPVPGEATYAAARLPGAMAEGDGVNCVGASSTDTPDGEAAENCGVICGV